MSVRQSSLLIFIVCLWICAFPVMSMAQTGNSSTISGIVLDPSGASVADAVVSIHDPVSGYERSVTTDHSGTFSFPNVPFNPYHMTVTAKGFASSVQDIDVSSTVPVQVTVKLQLAGSATTVTVTGEASDLVENTATAHTDVDRSLFGKLPLESQSSSVSSLVTLAAPGISADSNGLFHGFGDHAENSFSVDGQPITDQQSKVFSNQIPLGSIESLEVIQGAPPAQYGDKTSLVINVTTRSGLGAATPHGSVTASYGTFGSSNAGFDLLYGGQKWGNYISVDGLNSGRFLDPPEFTVFHDKGNEENVFDRADYKLSSIDSLQLNLEYTRSWFQNPNSFDAQDGSAWFGFTKGNVLLRANDNGIGPNGAPVGPADQRSQIVTFDVAPTWTRLIGANTVFTLSGWSRRDAYNYYPSADPFADLAAPSLQRESIGQQRTLLNYGGRADLSYVNGIQNLQVGVNYMQTPVTENDTFGIVDPTVNAPCLDTSGFAVEGFTGPSQCAAAGDQANLGQASDPNLYPAFNPILLPFDLTRGGGLFHFDGHTDVKELALYAEDTLTKGGWNFRTGLRFDRYNGITSAYQVEPREGLAYNIKRTGTVLQLSYARTMETPFNENLVLSSEGCNSAVIAAIVSCVPAPVTPGFRNEFHAGLEQAFGRYLVINGEYVWKYTHNGFDFSDFGNTPIFFPIEWHNSKEPGFAVRASLPANHGVTAFVDFSSIAARFFTPQAGGLGTIPAVAGSGFAAFRIDHDEVFNETAHVQYQPWKSGPWIGLNWRYDSGLVAGASPCFGIEPFNTCPGSILPGGVPNVSMVVANVGSVPMTADQEFEAGFTCNGVRATATAPLPFNCPASGFGSTLIKVPAPNKEDDDLNPPRIAPRSLFDLAVGDDNLFHGDRRQWSARITVINLADTTALYNFASTFSGTHYVTPRTLTGEIGFHF